MSLRTNRTGDDLVGTLTDALTAFLGADSGQVQVNVDDGLTAKVEGPFHVELRAGASEGREGDQNAQPGTPAPRSSRDEPPTTQELDEEADAAADFLEGFLDAMDLPGDLKIRVHEDHAEVEIADVGTGALIGRRGQTLDALQELVRSSLQRQFERRTHVQIDAERYRARRMEKLLEKVDAAIEEALQTGDPVRLEPMDVFERKAVHHRVAEVDGVLSKSQGREPARRVVIERD